MDRKVSFCRDARLGRPHKWANGKKQSEKRAERIPPRLELADNPSAVGRCARVALLS